LSDAPSENSPMRSMTSVDGVITPTEDARVPVLDRGFLYGDSVYEVFRTYDGVPLFYEEHWARFRNSASLIHLDIGFGLDELSQRIKAVVDATGAPDSRTDVYVRYAVTRGVGEIDLFPDPSLVPSCVIIAKAAPVWSAALYEHGMRLAI